MNILTIGGYGYNDVGDEAQPHAVIDNLIQELGDDASIVMLSPNPDFTKDYHKQNSEPDIVFISRDNWINTLCRKHFEQLPLIIDYYNILFYAWVRKVFKIQLPIRKEIVRIVDRIIWADIVINVGGGNINSIMRNELRKRTCIHRIAKIFNKKVFVSNQTIGPFYYYIDKRMAKTALQRVDLLTFRDQVTSRERCQKIRINNRNMFDAADDAISLFSISKEEALTLIKNDVSLEWFELQTDYIFGINIKGSLTLFKGKDRTSSMESEVTKLAQISEYILKKYNSKILFISTDFCPSVDDRPYLEEIKNKLDKELSPKTAVLQKEYTDYQLKGITSTLDFALGVRYHFIVFCLSQFVPSIGVASGEYQRTKLDGIFNLSGLPDYCIQQDLEYIDVNLVFPVIDELIKNRLFITKQLQEIIPQLIEKSKATIYNVKRLHKR